MAKTLQQVMKEYPDLTVWGFCFQTDMETDRKALSLAESDFLYCVEWIDKHIRPSKYFDSEIGMTSYGLKHTAEKQSPNKYLPSGTFIAALIALEDRAWKRIPKGSQIQIAVRKPLDPWIPRYEDFYAWLKRQSERGDPIGDFARDIIELRYKFVCLGNPIFEPDSRNGPLRTIPFQSNELFDWFKSLSYYLDSVVMRTMIESFIAYYDECGQSQLFRLALSSIRMNPEMSEYISKQVQLREFLDELGDVF